MKRRPWLFSVAGAAMSVSMLAAVARADVPPAMDRVPADAPIVISMKNVGQFYTGIKGMAQSLSLPMEAMGGLNKAGEMLKMEGLNPDGSAAIAMMGLPGKGEDGEDSEPPMVMIVPVKEYGAFAKALGGKGEGVEQVTIEDKPAFVKDIGGGFAAIGPKQEMVQGFAGKAGSGKALEALMGPAGRSVADSSGTIIVANIEKLAPTIREGFKGFKEQVEGAAAMAGGEGAAQQMEQLDKTMEGYLRDATSAVIGFNTAEAGVKLDFASQFKEGSEFAGYFAAPGKASTLTGALPNQPFLFALTLDTSAPGFRKLLGQMAAANKMPEGLGALNPLAMIEKMDGIGFSMGTSPALMGGLFLNTTAYVKTSDPAGYIKSLKEMMSGLNGKTSEGITFQTSFESGAAKVGEKAVDTWGMRMQVDPASPAAQQIGQMQMMLFGPTGLSGYVAQAEGGVVMTYSKNSDLMGKALDAAKTGSGLTGDAGIKAIAEQLPANRSMEAYIGVKSILETALGFMGMMGAGPANFEVPADLPPIGLGGTTNNGGMRVTMFMPTQVLKTFKALGDSMGGGMGEGGDEDDAPAPKEKAGQPKF